MIACGNHYAATPPFTSNTAPNPAEFRASLPNLRDLQLTHSTLLPGQRGEQLLQQLLAGAAGSLLSLNLQDCAFSGSLASLAGATHMTFLEVSGENIKEVERQTVLPFYMAGAFSFPGHNKAAHLLRTQHFILPTEGISHRAPMPIPATPILSRLPATRVLLAPVGTHVADCHMADLALLPLASLSLAGTAVGDDGIEQLIAMTSLCQLDLR